MKTFSPCFMGPVRMFTENSFHKMKKKTVQEPWASRSCCCHVLHSVSLCLNLRVLIRSTEVQKTCNRYKLFFQHMYILKGFNRATVTPNYKCVNLILWSLFLLFVFSGRLCKPASLSSTVPGSRAFWTSGTR